ncbi:MAG: acetate kinase [Bacteroidia bacterium]|nr:acetate kinase [Bacteroidia bacterium]
MKILVLNCGSSSIKYQFFDMTTVEVLAKGLVDKIGLKGSLIKHDLPDGEKLILEGEILDHQAGIEYLLGVLTSKEHGCIKDMNEINAVGHRVAHGGENFSKSEFITKEVESDIEKLFELAPLHNPHHMKGIKAMELLLPGVPQCAVFDTAFHQTLPDYAYMYAIPYSLYKKYHIRRYGFHGTSHKFVAEKACKTLGIDFEKSKIITAHLGNGASIAAICNGKSVDTSMGLTPVEGLMMGTRAGDLDLGVLLYVMDKEEIGIATTNSFINKHCGVLGVSGISSDMREVENAADQGNERAILALNMYAYRIKKYIGAYAAAMNGVDLLVLTGGIGENDVATREKVCSDMEFMGIEFDKKMNQGKRGVEVIISHKSSKVTVIVEPTNEELVIATDTMNIVKEMKKSKK